MQMANTPDAKRMVISTPLLVFHTKLATMNNGHGFDHNFYESERSEKNKRRSTEAKYRKVSAEVPNRPFDKLVFREPTTVACHRK